MSRHRSAIMAAALAIPLALTAPACSSAVFSVITFRREAPFSRLETEQIEDLLQSQAPSKSRVLALLGPPLSVIGQSRGDVFVYRRQAADTNIININPAFLVSASPPLSVYYDSDESYRDDILMVFFDTDGRARGCALTLGSRIVEESRAARLGETVQDVLR